MQLAGAYDGWDEVGENVFRKRFNPYDVSVTAVVGSAGVAVVDTRCSLAEAREIKDQLRRLTATPIRWVVNTHAHFDHCWGNAEFVGPRLTPPARIWGHESLAARLEFTAPSELVRDRDSIPLGDRTLERSSTSGAAMLAFATTVCSIAIPVTKSTPIAARPPV